MHLEQYLWSSACMLVIIDTALSMEHYWDRHKMQGGGGGGGFPKLNLSNKSKHV